MMTTDTTQAKEALHKIIMDQGYFREKIILSSGKTSDYYIDARRVTLTAEGALLTAKLILAEVANDTYDAIGGPTLGADPMVGAIGVLSIQGGHPTNTFIIRKTAKAHGKQQQIEGPDLNPGSKVILIDDVATTGKAFLESMDVLKAADIEIVKAICIVDRNEGAKETIAEKGVELVSLFHIDEIH